MFIIPLEDREIRWSSDHLECDEYRFKQGIQNVSAYFVPCIDLVSLMNISLVFIDANGFLAIFFWTITGINVVN